MKRTLQKPVALFLALIMAFGAMPFAGIGMLVSAADPVLLSVAIDPASLTLTGLGETYTLKLTPTWQYGSGVLEAKYITWNTSNPEYLTVTGKTTSAAADIEVQKLPAKIGDSYDVTVTAQYLDVKGVFKTATSKVTITRTDNENLNILKNIKFDPDTALLKTIGETLGLKLKWNWNPDIADSQKFPLDPNDLTFESSKPEYVMIERKDPENTTDPNNPLYTDSQDVITLKVMKLPATVGESVDVKITATYANNKNVIRTATAMITVMHFEEEIVLKEIVVSPDKATMTKLNDSVQLNVSPVWLNDKPGVFNANDVIWALEDSTQSQYVTVTDKGLVTVRKLPANVGDSVAIKVKASYYYGSNTEPLTSTSVITLINPALIPVVETVSLAPDAITMKHTGDKEQLYLIATYVEKDESGNIISTFSKRVSDEVSYRSSDDNYIRVSSSGLMEVVNTPAPNAPQDAVVTVTATFEGKSAVCKVTIPRRQIYVNRINLDWKATAVVTEIEYSYDQLFRYTAYLTETPPEGMTVDKSITLSATPASAVDIDPYNQKVSFRPISGNSASVTLTVTANNPSEDFEPVSFTVTVYDDVPLDKVLWDYQLGSTGITRFRYYDDSSTGVKQIRGYYYESNVGSVPVYSYHTVPEYARSICTFKITVSNPRVLRVDEKTKCLIPVGNGETKLTITATTPKKATRSHTIIVHIDESPYNPIVKVGIGYDPNSVSEGVTYSSSDNTLSMMYGQSIKLVPKLSAELADKTAKLEQEEIKFRTIDGRTLVLVETPTYGWRSDNPEVASVDPKTGEVTVHRNGNATITLHIEDNGEEFNESIHIKAKMTWWQALLGILFSLVTFNWKKIPEYVRAFFESLF